MSVMIIEPLPVDTNSNYHTRRCVITRKNGSAITDTQELWFKFSDKITPPDDRDCDGYLLAMVMDAMNERRAIVIKGSVSKELLSNLVEYQSVWHKWLPNDYSIIDMTADSIRYDEYPASGAICAFSGGVDATFSVWRHTHYKNSYRSQKINLCSIVHGFDIPLSESKAFENAKNTAANTLDDIGIGLFPVYTNYRSISSLDWNHTHGCVLVATLSNFKSAAGTCIIGSSNDYKNLRLPWGSTPLADHLLGSGEFKVLHDGASHSRTEKVQDISEWKMGIDNLRVCWESDLYDRNCGKCEKCLRTQANFLAIEKPIPSCFPGAGNTEINLHSLVEKKLTFGLIIEWRDIFCYAQKNNIQWNWVTEVEKIINGGGMINPNATNPPNQGFLHKIITYAKKSTITNTLLPFGSQQRLIIGNLLKKLKKIN